MKIAEVNGLYFDIPDNVWYSFFNSPYPAHRLGTAVDVYFCEKALFPFEEGMVEEIRKIRTPQHIPYESDYLILVRVKGFCLKILHVKPDVEVGETLYCGDEIGELILSGFFYPWSDRHAHFELRNCGDRYRARGGYPIKPMSLNLVSSSAGDEFEVVERKDFYYWLKPVERNKRSLTPLSFQGFSIEGGLPHYGYGAVFGNTEKAEVFGKTILFERNHLENVKLFKTDFEVFANDQRVRGIGIYCNQKKIKLIGGNFMEGDLIKLSFIRPTHGVL